MNTRKTMHWMASAALALAFLLSSGASTPAQPVASLNKAPAPASGLRISGPFSRENLSIFLIHGKDSIKGKNFLTLKEALNQKKVVVYETSNVNELSIENRSDELVFIQSGEIVKGGQQDRTFRSDVILPPRSGKVPIAAFCVEHGRWSQRGQEPVGTFASSVAALPTPALKMAARYAGDQNQVWEKVTEAQNKLSSSTGVHVSAAASPSSLELSLENEKVQKNAKDRCAGLAKIIDGQKDVIGYACVINGKVTGADLYGSNALFTKMWPKLLQASAVESLTEYQAGKKFTQVQAGDVSKFLAKPVNARLHERKVGERTKELRQEAADCVLFQTKDREGGEAAIHQNYLTK